jgi:hypothetical protein
MRQSRFIRLIRRRRQRHYRAADRAREALALRQRQSALHARNAIGTGHRETATTAAEHYDRVLIIRKPARSRRHQQHLPHTRTRFQHLHALAEHLRLHRMGCNRNRQCRCHRRASQGPS